MNLYHGDCFELMSDSRAMRAGRLAMFGGG